MGRKRREVRLIDGVEHLCCTKCREWKPVLGFLKKGRYKDGSVMYKSHCKECRKEYDKQYNKDHKEYYAEYNKQRYENNKEYYAEKNKRYRENNKEKVAKRKKQWCKNNKEYCAEYRKQYYENNKEKHAEYRKQYQKNNKEKVYTHYHNRNAIKKALPADLTVSEYTNIVNNVFNNKCVLSGKENPSREHFIPLSWGCEGNTIGNVYPMELSLNISKHNKNPFDWIKTQPEHYQEQFYNVLVPYLADLNEMSVEVFQDYVYFCEANKRTLAETEADFEKGITMRDKFEQYIIEIIIGDDLL